MATIAELEEAVRAADLALTAADHAKQAAHSAYEDATIARATRETELANARLAISQARPLTPTHLAFLRKSAQPGGHTYAGRKVTGRHESRVTKTGLIAQSLMHRLFVKLSPRPVLYTFTATITPLGLAKLAEHDAATKAKRKARK